MKKKIKFLIPDILVSQNTAIIGNSSSILKKKNGLKIDICDDVIRFNNAKTKGFEEYVGKKTTIRVINNGTFECNKIKPGLGWEKSDNDYNFVLSLNNIKIITISPNKIKNEIKNKNMKNNNYYYFLEKRYIQFLICFSFIKNLDIFFELINILLKRKNFSIGFYTILLCIASGIKPHLYGFDLSEDMTKRSHYWEKAGNVGNFHNLSLEHQIINKFLRLNYIELH